MTNSTLITVMIIALISQFFIFILYFLLINTLKKNKEQIAKTELKQETSISTIKTELEKIKSEFDYFNLYNVRTMRYWIKRLRNWRESQRSLMLTS